jgi:hypothetical protein
MTTLTAPETYALAVNPRSLVSILADLDARLTEKGFTPGSWSDSDYKKAIRSIVGDVREGDEQVRAQIFKGGYLADAEFPYLDLMVAGFFQIVRQDPTTTVIRLRLSDTSNTARSPFSQPLVAVWNPDDEDAALYFRSPAGVLVPKNGYVDVDFTAERPGAAYNVSPGTVTNLTTPIPGVALTSPAIPGTSTIVVAAGQDAESDASLREAARNKWSLLRRGWSARTIKALLRDFLPGATRVYVRDDNPLPGEAWVYMATATGAVSGDDVVAAYDYFRSEDIKPLSNKRLRFFAASIGVYTLTGPIYTDGEESSILLAQQRLSTYMTNYPLGSPIYRSRLADVIIDPTLGVQGVALAGIPEILTPGDVESVQFTWDLTQADAELLQ